MVRIEVVVDECTEVDRFELVVGSGKIDVVEVGVVLVAHSVKEYVGENFLLRRD